MNPSVYKQRMDRIILDIERKDFRTAVRAVDLLVKQSNVMRQTVESQLKTALFQIHGPKVDKIWTSFSMAQTAAA